MHTTMKIIRLDADAWRINIYIYVLDVIEYPDEFEEEHITI